MMTKRVVRVPIPSPPWSSEKTEAFADSLENQIQPVNYLLVQAVVEIVDVVLKSYFSTPASEINLANHYDVHKASVVSR